MSNISDAMFDAGCDNGEDYLAHLESQLEMHEETDRLYRQHLRKQECQDEWKRRKRRKTEILKWLFSSGLLQQDEKVFTVPMEQVVRLKTGTPINLTAWLRSEGFADGDKIYGYKVQYTCNEIEYENDSEYIETVYVERMQFIEMLDVAPFESS